MTPTINAPPPSRAKGSTVSRLVPHISTTGAAAARSGRRSATAGRAPDRTGSLTSIVIVDSPLATSAGGATDHPVAGHSSSRDRESETDPSTLGASWADMVDCSSASAA